MQNGRNRSSTCEARDKCLLYSVSKEDRAISYKEIIGGVTESPVHSAQPKDQAVALGEAFDAGVGVFEQQLVQLSDQQYVRLLTLLDEYPAPLRT